MAIFIASYHMSTALRVRLLLCLKLYQDIISNSPAISINLVLRSLRGGAFG